MRNFTYLFIALLLSTISWQTTAQVTIGQQDGTTSNIPIHGIYEYSYSQQVVYQSEINAAGNITSISFFFSTGSASATAVSDDWNIYLGHTTKTEFTDNDDWVASANLTQVFSGSVAFPAAGNLMEIVFDTPFNYNNIDNLVVAVTENKPGWGSISFGKTTTIANSNRGIYWSSDTVTPDINSPATAKGRLAYINNMILGGIQQSCPAPSGLIASNVSQTSADVDWTENGSSSEWEVVYGLFGFDPTNSGVATTVSITGPTTGATLIGLNHSSEYEFYVRSICSVTDESSLVGPTSFKTACDAMATMFEDFDSYATGSIVPDCWERVAPTTSVGSQTISSTSPASGTRNIYQYASSTSNPVIVALPEFSNINAGTHWLKLKARVGSGAPGTLSVGYMMDVSDYNDFTLIEDLSITNTSYATDSEYSVVIPATVPSGARLAIKNAADAKSYYWDDVYWEMVPSCLPPTALATTTVAITTADIEWVAGDSETSWNISWGASGYTPGDIDEVGTDTANATSYQITGLNSSSDYEFYVQADCGGDLSGWSGPIGFSTICVAVSDFFEGFEATTGTDFPNCWSKVGTIGSADTRTSTKMSGNRVMYMYNNATVAMPIVDNASAGTHQMTMNVVGNISTGGNLEFGYLTDVTDANTFTLVSSFVSNSTTTPEEFSIIPSGMPAGDVTFALYLPGTTSVLIDDVRWEPIPSCLAPTALATTTVATTTADIEWIAGDTETSWNVSWGTPGYTPGDTDEINTATVGITNYQITGLMANTGYDVYVQADCSGDLSSWTGPLSFNTPCLPGAVPFDEGFESGYTHNVTLGNCWSQESVSGSGFWTVNNTLTNYNRTPRSGDYNIFLQYGNEDWIFYPFDLTAGTSYELKFYARQDATIGADVEAAFGTIDNEAGMTTPIIATSPVISGDYQEFSGYFSPANSGVYYIGIKGTLSFTPWYLSIDDISVEEVAGCLEPSNLMASNISVDSADLTWIINSSETEWEVLYGEAGFNPLTAGTTVSVNNNPEVTISGLDDNTEYEFYVTAICDVNDESGMVGPVSFTTLCGATAVPYLVDFETATTPNLPNCTSAETLAGSDWETATAPIGFTGNVLRYKWHTSTGNADSWFYTQGVELEAGVNYEISYKYGNNSTTYIESMKVAYGTSPEGTEMTNQLADYPSIQLPAGQPEDELITFTVAADGVYYFGFNAYSATNQFYLYLDDISIDVAPVVCDAVINVDVTAIDLTTATVSWTASPTATDGYIVNVYEAGTTTTAVFTDTVAAGVTTAAITGLTSDTAYDVYVTSDCGGGDTATSAVVTFTTDSLVCDAVTNVVVSAIDLTTATVSWTASATATDGYIVNVYETGTTTTAVFTDTVAAGVTTAAITGLTSDTAYDVYVTSDCGFDTTTAAPVTFTTDDLICEAPTDVEVSEITATEATVSWTASATAVDGYVVDVYEAGADVDTDTAVFTEVVAAGVTTVEVTDLTHLTSYDVYVTSDCGNGETAISDVVSFTTEDIASVGDFDFVKLTLYPNPVSTELNISAAKIIDEVQVYNILGQHVMTRKSNDSEITLDVTRLPSATYVIKVTVEGVVSTARFVKK